MLSILRFCFLNLCLLILSFLPIGELSGQMLSFAANTIYMAISCSNLQPKTEPGEKTTTGKEATSLLNLFDHR